MKRRAICALAVLVFGAALLCHVVLVLHDLPKGWVEVIVQEGAAAEQVLRQAADQEGWDQTIDRDSDRLVIWSEHRFAAQIIQAALENQGVQAEVLDYAWAPAVLAQSGGLWLVWGALLGLWLLWALFWAQARQEWDSAQGALEDRYWGEYLSDAGVRLLAKAIGLSVGVIVTILLLQWLWRAQVTLPPGLLPEGSVFDAGHYRLWAQNTFPDGRCSAYSADLAARLRLGHLLAAAECAALTAGVVSLRRKIKHKGEIRNEE